MLLKVWKISLRSPKRPSGGKYIRCLLRIGMIDFATERQLTERRIAERRITERRITKGRITEGRKN
jgi:hypothetical protein